MEAPGQTDASGDSSEDGGVLDLADDEGWEDLEPDVEPMQVCCLFCDRVFQEITGLLPHCRDDHGLDMVKIQKDLGV